MSYSFYFHSVPVNQRSLNATLNTFLIFHLLIQLLKNIYGILYTTHQVTCGNCSNDDIVIVPNLLDPFSAHAFNY